MPDLRPVWPKHYRRDWIADGPAGVSCADCLYAAGDACLWILTLPAPASAVQSCCLFEQRPIPDRRCLSRAEAAT